LQRVEDLICRRGRVADLSRDDERISALCVLTYWIGPSGSLSGFLDREDATTEAAAEGLKAIGLPHLAKHLLEANSVFGPHGATPGSTQKQLGSLPRALADRFARADWMFMREAEAIADKCVAWLEAHPERFDWTAPPLSTMESLAARLAVEVKRCHRVIPVSSAPDQVFIHGLFFTKQSSLEAALTAASDQSIRGDWERLRACLEAHADENRRDVDAEPDGLPPEQGGQSLLSELVGRGWLRLTEGEAEESLAAALEQLDASRNASGLITMLLDHPAVDDIFVHNDELQELLDRW